MATTTKNPRYIRIQVIKLIIAKNIKELNDIEEISNEALYKRCNTRPLSETVTEARWNMVGHVLRMDRNAQAQNVLQYAVEGAKKYRDTCLLYTSDAADE